MYLREGPTDGTSIEVIVGSNLAELACVRPLCPRSCDYSGLCDELMTYSLGTCLIADCVWSSDITNETVWAQLG